MHLRTVVAALLSVALPGQVGPSLLAPHASSGWLDVTVPPLNAFFNPGAQAGILSLAAGKLPTDPPGIWTLCLTLRYAINCPGCGAGPADTLIARVDITTNPPTLTQTNEAALVNSGGEKMFRIEPGQGLLAVYENFWVLNGVVFGGVYLVDRPNVGAQFGNPRLIYNVRGLFGDFADPAIGYVFDGTNHKLKLFWVGANYVTGTFQPVRGIWMDDLDITALPATPFVSGRFQLAALESRPGWAINSPSPIAGPDGDVEAMLVWERDWQSTTNARDNDAFFADDFDASTPNTEAMDTAGTWTNNGTMLGNLVLAAENYSVYPIPSPAGPNYRAAREGTSAWLIGDYEPIGSLNPVDVRVGAPIGSLAFVFIAPALLPVPIPLPVTGGIGQVGIGPGPATLCFLPVGLDAIADYAFPAPVDPALAGVWPIQGVVVNPATNQIATTNTAKIRL